MSNTSHRLSKWVWYLVPGNPILVRVVQGMSRRPRHMWLRLGYLVVLLSVVLVGLLSGGTSQKSLATLAKGASTTFTFASITQLLLMCFLSPVFTAGAITQERDAQTFNILISTPLSNAQIVIGSLLSRLFFVIVLLLAGLPIFFTTMIYGGVTAGQIVRSFGITGATAILTGSLAITISMIRVGTRKTIFSFFLAIGLYLCVIYAMGQWWSATKVSAAPITPGTGAQMSWLAAFHPFLALDVALNRVEAPDISLVGEYGPLGKYFVAYPPTVYVLMTLVISVMLVVVSMFFVRRCTRQGELSLLDRIVARFRPARNGGERTRKPRAVWANPVAWREAMTRASGSSAGATRTVVIAAGLIGALVLLAYYLKESSLTVDQARMWLAGVVAVEFAVALLIATNTAATALTREKESQTIDLMLATPLTSRYIIWGKLRGLVSFVVPLIAVPVVSLLIFAVCDLIRSPAQRVVYIETAVWIAVLLVVFSAYACMLGLHFSLKNKKTVRAVIIAVGVMLVINLGAFLFWEAVVERAGVSGAALAPATPFTAILILIDPLRLFDSPADLASHAISVRFTAAIGSLIFIVVHGLIVYAWYKSMVRNFDMVIRKQSGQ